ncbi:hypothetical protein AB1Y20_002000 [Prymnesium parvum]|uniref:Uncharacterized protein n=1 Tax=Prymnesium parvum TaxID=97485 RepID=A0AB34J9X8_PRYPA
MERSTPASITRLMSIAAAVAVGALVLHCSPLSESAGQSLLGCAASDRPPCTAGVAARLHLDDQHLHGGWKLARTLGGEQWLKVYTRLEAGMLRLRVEGELHSTATRILSVLREVDLLPRWNRFCDRAAVLRAISPYQLWVGAGVRLPWPIRPQALLLRAWMADDPQSTDGLVALAQSVTPALKLPHGVRLPSELQHRLDLPVALAVGRLRPLTAESPPPGGYRTRIDAFLAFNLSQMPYLAAATHTPHWIVNMIVWVLVPSIWSGYLTALLSIDEPASLHAARLDADTSGLYSHVAKRTRHPSKQSHRSNTLRKRCRWRLLCRWF